MVKVAIAGGTGGVGRAIAEAILAIGKHDVYILSRSSVSFLSLFTLSTFQFS
jgi:nucleoside-diphosphate-sugar epimerase